MRASDMMRPCLTNNTVIADGDAVVAVVEGVVAGCASLGQAVAVIRDLGANDGHASGGGRVYHAVIAVCSTLHHGVVPACRSIWH